MAMPSSMTRKQFLQGTAVLAFVPALACDDGGGEGEAEGEEGESAGGDCSGGAAGTVTSNHGHEAMLAASAITGGAATDLDITGSSPHSHTVSLSADQLASIAAGERVTVTSSSGGGHTHDVTFEC
jgi:hypothetical protein